MSTFRGRQATGGGTLLAFMAGMILQTPPDVLRPRGHGRAGGFTLVELMVAAAVFLIGATTTVVALTSANNVAVKSRIQASAQAIVQNHVDQILSRGPYVPSNTPPDIPTELKLGTTTQSNLAVFTDPASGMDPVRGTLKVKISEGNFSINGVTLDVRQASVVLDYVFRGRNYTVASDILRAPDQ